MPSEVPEGWRSGRVSDLVAEVTTRINPQNFADPEMRYLGLEDIGQGTGTVVSIGRAGDATSQKSRFAAGDILFGKLRPNLRKVARPDFDGMCSTDISVFRAKPHISPDFAFRVLSSDPVIKHAVANSAGTKMPRTHARSILSFETVLPPLDEQQRIADVLRSLDDATASQGAVVETATGVRQRLSSAYFIDPAEYGGPHPFGSFGDLFDIKGGSQPPKSTFAYEPNPGFVRLLQIRDFERDDKAAYIAENASSVRCREDDILIARYGASVGRILTGKAGAYNVALTKVVFRTDRVHRRYAYHWLKSDYFQGRIAAVSGRSAQAGFNKEDLFPTQLVLPAYQEQEMVADTLDDLESQVDLARRAQNAVVALKESLRSDLLSGRVRVPA